MKAFSCHLNEKWTRHPLVRKSKPCNSGGTSKCVPLTGVLVANHKAIRGGKTSRLVPLLLQHAGYILVSLSLQLDVCLDVVT